MKLERQPDTVAKPQAFVALAQEVVAGPHALLQVAESGLEAMSRSEEHAQLPGLRHTRQVRPIALAGVPWRRCPGQLHDDFFGPGWASSSKLSTTLLLY